MARDTGWIRGADKKMTNERKHRQEMEFIKIIGVIEWTRLYKHQQEILKNQLISLDSKND